MKSPKPIHQAIEFCCILLLMLYFGLVASLHADDSNSSHQGEPLPVRYLTYQNCGAYTVQRVRLHWKANGKKHSSPVASNLEGDYKLAKQKNNATCVDLTDAVFDVPENAEVWLSFDIESGDSKNCRKDTLRVFDSTSKYNQSSKSKGQTLTNNRCENKSYSELSDAKSCKLAFTKPC